MINNILEKYSIHGFSVEYFTVNPKQNFPSIICKAKDTKDKYFMIKILIKYDIHKNHSLNKQVNLLNRFYPNLLNAKFITDSAIKMNFINGTSFSSLLRIPFIGRGYALKAIDWLVKFHNNNHNNGIGHIHGDFSAYEVIQHDNDIVVFDWEDYREKEEQLIDIIYFIFRDTFQDYFFGSKQVSYQNFIDYVISDSKIHYYLRYYIRKRNDIIYDRNRRKKALFDFLENRITRENKNYLIPRKDRYIYKKIYESLINYR